MFNPSQNLYTVITENMSKYRYAHGYAGIPKSCEHCVSDLLEHQVLHLVIHELGYDRITLRRSRNRNRIFHYLIPVLLTGTGIGYGKSGSGRTGTGFFRIESGSGKNRISRSDRNSGRNRNITNAIPARTEMAENDKNRFIR